MRGTQNLPAVRNRPRLLRERAIWQRKEHRRTGFLRTGKQQEEVETTSTTNSQLEDAASSVAFESSSCSGNFLLSSSIQRRDLFGIKCPVEQRHLVDPAVPHLSRFWRPFRTKLYRSRWLPLLHKVWTQQAFRLRRTAIAHHQRSRRHAARYSAEGRSRPRSTIHLHRCS